MGRVRTKTVKKSSRQVIEKYYSRMTLDFHTNKKILEEVAIIPSKRLRNKIAGFSTHLMKRIQKGPVRGISLKLQEEERERRMDFVPDESAIKTDDVKVDKETLEMLASLGMSDVSGFSQVETQAVVPSNAFGRASSFSVCNSSFTKLPLETAQILQPALIPSLPSVSILLLRSLFFFVVIDGISTGRVQKKRRGLSHESVQKDLRCVEVGYSQCLADASGVGGIDEGEDPRVAVMRELKEETGVHSAEIIAEAPHWITYDFPPDVREKLKVRWGTDWKGQAQKWFLLKFTGKDEEINLLGDGTEQPEFGEWSWVSPDQLVDLAVDFKKPVYKEVVSAFASHLQ
ncbi:hypothetical protein Bca4012_085503 [Brassica carinata]